MRIPLIHFLAVRPVSEKYLAQTIGCSVAECRQVLEKVGKEYRLDKSKWDLNDKFFKELDPYFFNYPSQDDRKLAIDRAISAFDRQRISSGDPMWQKLLPVHERGKGKSLSKLELKKEAPRIQKATTPRINVQATENTATGGLTPSNDSDAKLDRLAPSDAEAKAPSGPRGPAVKPKPGDRQPKKGPPQKSTRASKVQKPKDTKKDSRKGAAKAQAKSSEFVHDSDEDEDEEMTDASAQQGKPDTLKNTPVDAKNPLAAPASKPRSKDAPTKAKSNGITAVQRQSPSALHSQTADKRPPLPTPPIQTASIDPQTAVIHRHPLHNLCHGSVLQARLTNPRRLAPHLQPMLQTSTLTAVYFLPRRLRPR